MIAAHNNSIMLVILKTQLKTLDLIFCYVVHSVITTLIMYFSCQTFAKCSSQAISHYADVQILQSPRMQHTCTLANSTTYFAR
jgi:hypothetical protein